jgi:hypothetical protein
MKYSNSGYFAAMHECPLLAQSGHPTVARPCLLLGVKQTSMGDKPMSAFDPKRTLVIAIPGGDFCTAA